MISIQRWAIVACAFSLAVFVAACGGGKEEVSKDADEAASNAALEKAISKLPPDQRPTIERGESGDIRYEGQTESGEKFTAQIGGKVSLPKIFPDDLPLYPDAVPFSSMETGSGTAFVSLDADTQAPAVYEFYKRELPASGWTIENEVNLSGQRVLTAVKGDRKAVVHIEGTKKGARIGFTLSPVS